VFDFSAGAFTRSAPAWELARRGHPNTPMSESASPIVITPTTDIDHDKHGDDCRDDPARENAPRTDQTGSGLFANNSGILPVFVRFLCPDARREGSQKPNKIRGFIGRSAEI
jgi:hypothetical protein